MGQQLLIAGGGIGGLAVAIAAARAGWESAVFEQAEAFTDVGAGIQLGPNATRILRQWELLAGDLGQRVARPGRLQVRDALDGRELGVLRVDDFEQRYGAPYVTAHRADLHSALFDAAWSAGAHMHAQQRAVGAENGRDGVRVHFEDGRTALGDALVGSDGLWSRVRRLVAGPAAPTFTGHVAYRALLPQASVPEALRSGDVTAWLGPRLHLVAYPVRAGEFLNVVCVVEGGAPPDATSWDQAAAVADLQAAMGPTCAAARALVEAVEAWRLWALHARAPVAGAFEMARGRIALAGDAAHPMPPYLAQGAGMAIEDARELQRVLAADLVDGDIEAAFARYARDRWQRCARVQARSLRNGRIFHARGPVRIARNASLRLIGERLLDVPWLYSR